MLYKNVHLNWLEQKLILGFSPESTPFHLERPKVCAEESTTVCSIYFYTKDAKTAARTEAKLCGKMLKERIKASLYN